MKNKEALIKEISSLIVTSVNLHHIDASTLTAETPLTQGGLGLDSVDILEVVVAIEQHFHVRIKNAEMGRKYFSSIGSIAEFVTILQASSQELEGPGK